MAIFLALVFLYTNLLKIESLNTYFPFRNPSSYHCDTDHLISNDWFPLDDVPSPVCWSYDECPIESPKFPISEQIGNFSKNTIKFEPHWGNYRSNKGKHTIYLIRHGQYHYRENDEKRKLTKKGRAQAKRTGIFLRDSNIVFHRAIYSTMTRATETFNLIRQELNGEQLKKYEKEKMIEEGYPYPSAGEEVPDQYKSHYIETNNRLELAFQKYFETFEHDVNTLMVCHGNVIRYLLIRFVEFPPEFWTRFDIRHTSITKLQIHSNGNISFLSYGDANHLPFRLQTNE
ncbi:hypothetical protein SNEBB_001017 [Seison nebaliae]|nr:hypothetical protein SNEBB_001017 [Seison nebaliae]